MAIIIILSTSVFSRHFTVAQFLNEVQSDSIEEDCQASDF